MNKFGLLQTSRGMSICSELFDKIFFGLFLFIAVFSKNMLRKSDTTVSTFFKKSLNDSYDE